MNKQLLIYLLIASVFMACEAKNKRKLAAANKMHFHKNTTPKVAVNTGSAKVLMSKTYLHAFSDEFMLDTFKLILTGKSLTRGILTFEIISFNKGEIYVEHDHGYDLLGDLDDMSERQNEDTIKARFNRFLTPDAFSKPALDRKVDLADTDYVDAKTQQDIGSDTTSIGFTYNIGYESTIEIAYSKRTRKTVVCYASD